MCPRNSPLCAPPAALTPSKSGGRRGGKAHQSSTKPPPIEIKRHPSLVVGFSQAAPPDVVSSCRKRRDRWKSSENAALGDKKSCGKMPASGHPQQNDSPEPLSPTCGQRRPVQRRLTAGRDFDQPIRRCADAAMPGCMVFEPRTLPRTIQVNTALLTNLITYQ
jgi:hypothetical protein